LTRQPTISNGNPATADVCTRSANTLIDKTHRLCAFADNRGQSKYHINLRIWGSGVRIFPGAPFSILTKRHRSDGRSRDVHRSSSAGAIIDLFCVPRAAFTP
jgi:hypothetical protein